MTPEAKALVTNYAANVILPRLEKATASTGADQVTINLAAALIRRQAEEIEMLARALNDCPTDQDINGVYDDWRNRNAPALVIAKERA